MNESSERGGDVQSNKRASDILGDDSEALGYKRLKVDSPQSLPAASSEHQLRKRGGESPLEEALRKSETSSSGEGLISMLVKGQKHQKIEQEVPFDPVKDSSTGSTTAPHGSSLQLNKELEPVKPTVTFPQKLMGLLDQDDVKEAMWWLPDGNGFCLLPKLFPEVVLDKHFQGTKLESFTRKLNRWGFKRMTGQHVPLNTVAYHHPNFQRGKADMLPQMESGKKKDAVQMESFGRSNMRRDLEMASLSMPSSLLHHGSSAGNSGMFTGLSVRQQMLQQQQQQQHQQQQQQHVHNPLDQEIRLQSLLAQQESNDLAWQRNQLIAAEEEMLATQQRDAFRRMQLMRQGNLGGISRMIGPYVPSNQDMSSLYLAPPSPGSALPPPPPGQQGMQDPNQMDPRFVQLYMYDQQPSQAYPQQQYHPSQQDSNSMSSSSQQQQQQQQQHPYGPTGGGGTGGGGGGGAGSSQSPYGGQNSRYY